LLKFSGQTIKIACICAEIYNQNRRTAGDKESTKTAPFSSKFAERRRIPDYKLQTKNTMTKKAQATN
jgi:hypothetical protein